MNKFMRFIWISGLMLLLAGSLACNAVTSLVATPTPTPTHTPEPTETPTIIPSNTPEPTDTPEPTPVPTDTPAPDLLAGIRIKIIYIADRKADALEVQNRLEAQGADIIMQQVSNSGIAKHIGKIYYVAGNADLAAQVAAEVADVEVVAPAQHTVAPDAGQTLSLWIASSKTTAAPTAVPGGQALAGIRIKIIYIADREADALEAQSRLEAQGADIVMLEVDNSGISAHIGKIYYMAGNEDLAGQVAAEVADLEVVEPKLQTVAPDVGQKLNLWIASPATSAAATAAPRGGGLAGVKIKIIYIAARKADALEAQARLEAQGADIIMSPTSDSGNSAHVGKIYYIAGNLDVAEQVAAEMADIEPVVPTLQTIAPDMGQQLNFWIATLPTSVAPTAPAGSTSLAGIRIKIIYIAARVADAQEAQSRLEALGADIIMLQVNNSGISAHVGKIYYIEGNYNLAVQVAAEVADIETVTPTLQTIAPDVGQKLNLWIANP